MAGSDLIVQPIAMIGGLQDSNANPSPSDFVRLQNWTTFRGRFALRSPIFLLNTLTASDANATKALGGVYHDGKLWLAVFRDTNDDVRLWELTAAGAFVADHGALWTSISGAVPRPVFASFEGGSATAGTKRLYVADYDEQQITKFWDGSTISSLQVDFDNSGAAEDIKFHYVFSYQYHMWGAGFYQGTVPRKEMLRFSQPGIIPADDPDTTATTLVEWHAADFRSVGRRGDKITCLGTAGGAMIVGKSYQTYALYGYDRDSWALRQLSDRTGIVGPYAGASTGDGLFFFWSDRGPCVTDGESITDLSENVRKHVLEAAVSDANVVGFSGDDGLVYFGYPKGGATDPNYWLVFDKERKLWTEGDALATGGGVLGIRHLVAVPSTSLPGPVGAPSSLTAVGASDVQIDLDWVNGDIALDTQTEVYLDTSNPPTTLKATLSSGVNAYSVTGLTNKTTYFARVRHVRNGQNSSYSNVPSAKTFLTAPSAPGAIRRPSGVRYSFTNNENGADIVIERKKNSDSGWAVITTLLAQTTGAKTYDDSTTTCGLVYDYRSKATKAGELDSLYVATVTSAACNPPTLNTATHTLTLQSYCGYSPSGPTSVTVSWTGTNLQSTQTINIYRNVAGAGFVLRKSVAATVLSTTDLWTVKTGGVQKTLQFRLDLVEGGIVVDTKTTTQTAPFVADCI